MKGTLFIDALVREILADRKTVTRRRMRRQPDGVPPFALLPSPPGRSGETHYVREVWVTGPDGATLYRASHPDPTSIKWRSSLLMPATRARVFIRVTDVRPVRLSALDDAEAHLEGISDAATFRAGWNALHAAHPDALWERDPWVWRMEFVRVERPAEAPDAR